MENKSILLRLLLCSTLISCSSNQHNIKNIHDQNANWDLSYLYNSISDPRIAKDISYATKLANDFRQKYKGKLSHHNLLIAILHYEQIINICWKISSYSSLYVSTHQNDKKALSFDQSISEWSANLEKIIVFFPIEIMKLNENDLNKKMKEHPQLLKYKSWIHEVIKNKPYTLATEIEEALIQKQLVGVQAWRKFYEEVLTRIEIDFNGKKMGLPEIIKIANDSSDAQERGKAFIAISQKLKKENFYVRHIYNNIILNNLLECTLRKYKHPESSRNLSNNIDDETVDNLTNAVVENYKNISHRYFKIKARLLGKDKLEYWDRSAPVNLSKFFNKKIHYKDGKDLVLKVFGDFSPSFEKIASEFISKRWIDVYPQKGKISGAFACGTPINPYIMLNYFDNINDVSTLAHELGHGIHFYLSKENGPLLSHAPITLAETASLFAERLLAEHMYKLTKTDEEKIDFLCNKLDSTIASIMRQIAFFKFEKDIHELRKNQELSCDDISKLFLKNIREYLGDAVHVDECVGDTWAYINHIFAAPFYVYGYAFGELYVNALFEYYKNNKEDFMKKYIDMLSKGSIDRYDEAAAKFNLNPKKKEFWENGLKYIENEIDELEKLCKKAGYIHI